jgi:AcrR family transcriptional regulator
MPRHADAKLEGRILDAAYRLWSKGGESALTMRAVARGAKTTTPTVYQRFRDRHDILESLGSRARQNLFGAISPSKCLPELCERYFDFAVAHPNEYSLIHRDSAVRFAKGESQPGFEFLKKELAARLGGAPDQHIRLAIALAALLHGASILVMTKEIEARVAREIRLAATAASEALVEDAKEHRFRERETAAN